MNRQTVMTIAGFLIFFFGFLSMVFYLFAGGLRFSFLSFIDSMGTVPGFVIRLIMIFGGLVIFYVGRTGDSIE